jgi:hypothetical protein
MLWRILKWAGIEKAAEQRTLHSFGRYLIIRIISIDFNLIICFIIFGAYYVFGR